MDNVVSLRTPEASRTNTVRFEYRILKLDDRLAIRIVETADASVRYYPLTQRCAVASVGAGASVHDVGVLIREVTPLVRSMQDRIETSVHSLVYASFLRDLAMYDRMDETLRALENKPYHVSVGYSRLLLWSGKYLDLPIPPDLVRDILAYEP